MTCNDNSEKSQWKQKTKQTKTKTKTKNKPKKRLLKGTVLRFCNLGDTSSIAKII